MRTRITGMKMRKKTIQMLLATPGSGFGTFSGLMIIRLVFIVIYWFYY